jgi:hypothetical protein
MKGCHLKINVYLLGGISGVLENLVSFKPKLALFSGSLLVFCAPIEIVVNFDLYVCPPKPRV